MQITYASTPRYPSGKGVTPLSARMVNHSFSASLTLDEAIVYLEDELQSLGVESACIGTAYDQLKNDRQRRMAGSNSAASVTLVMLNREVTLVCDRWSATEQNLYALHLAIRALRNLDQWGVIALKQLLASMAGTSAGQPFQERRRSGGGVAGWMTALGLGPTASLKDANAVYRQRVKESSDDEHAMQLLNVAIEEARRALGNRTE